MNFPFRVAFYTTIVFLVIGAVVIFWEWVLNWVEPYQVLSAETVTPEVLYRGRVAVKYHIRQRRECEVQISRFVTGYPPDNTVYQRDQAFIPAGVHGVGDWPNVLNFYDLGSEVKPGMCYLIKINAVSRCTGFQIFSESAPPSKFCVVENDAGK